MDLRDGPVLYDGGGISEFVARSSSSAAEGDTLFSSTTVVDLTSGGPSRNRARRRGMYETGVISEFVTRSSSSTVESGRGLSTCHRRVLRDVHWRGVAFEGPKDSSSRVAASSSCTAARCPPSDRKGVGPVSLNDRECGTCLSCSDGASNVGLLDAGEASEY